MEELHMFFVAFNQRQNKIVNGIEGLAQAQYDHPVDGQNVILVTKEVDLE